MSRRVALLIEICDLINISNTNNVRSLYRAGSLAVAARELARYKLDLVDAQEVRWGKGGTVRAGRALVSTLMNFRIP